MKELIFTFSKHSWRPLNRVYPFNIRLSGDIRMQDTYTKKAGTIVVAQTGMGNITWLLSY